jgi:hypothetical protein
MLSGIVENPDFSQLKMEDEVSLTSAISYILGAEMQ